MHSVQRHGPPNILMFGDSSWIADRTARQERNFDEFVADHRDGSLVVIEMGAGTAIPTIRHASEQLGRRTGATVVRINPREGQIPPPHISISCGALEALRGIELAQKDPATDAAGSFSHYV